MLKVLGISGIQSAYLNIVKAIYSKPVANIKLNGEKLKQPTQIRDYTRLLTFFLPINIVFKVLARALNQQKKVKIIQIGIEEIKISLFEYGITVHLSFPPNSTRELLPLITSPKCLDKKLT